MEPFSLLNPLCFPPCPAPRTTQHSGRTGQALNTPHRDTKLCPLFPTGSCQALQSLLVWQLRAMELQPGCHCKYSWTTSYLQYSESCQFKSNPATLKEDSAPTENLAFNKVQELKQTPQNEKGHWFLKG